MKRTARRSSIGRWLLIAAVVIVLSLLAPSVFAAGLGRLVADLWVTVMGAVTGLFGGVFGS